MTRSQPFGRLLTAMVMWDLLYYWEHRWMHEVRVLWAHHVSHHSSERYNLSTAAPITGSLLPGISTGDVIAGVDQLSVEQLPRSMKTEWTELMFMQVKEGKTGVPGL